MTETTSGVTARQDWEQWIHRRSDVVEQDELLPPPSGLQVKPGAGHVRLSWDPVPGSVGYLIELSRSDGRPTILNHGGADVLAVPGPSFAVTGIKDGIDYRFRVAAISVPESIVRVWSEPISGHTLGATPENISVEVDASVVTGRLDRVWKMVGAERLSQLGLGTDEHGHDVGAEFSEALRIAHEDLGVSSVRAHGVFHDDLGIARRTDSGGLEFNFASVDAIYDGLLELGIRPIVELSFMPAALAQDCEKTVFTYRAIVSPPCDWGEWHDLVYAFVSHLVERYGLEEVAQWAFEVWNEPNLGVFWSGTREEYLRLYDEAARAIKAVGPALRVGGPSSAACEWVETLAAHARGNDVPLDFVSTHTYGNQPLDLRPVLTRHGFGGVPIWWTEWGAGSTHFGAIHDSVMGAPFILDGYAVVQGRIDALSYWVVSDHFAELGRPPRLFHGGFGLLTVGNLRKPRYWAVHLAAHQGDDVLSSTVQGDGAEVLVKASATSHDNGGIDVLVWNGTINSEVTGGDTRLDRKVRVSLVGLSGLSYEVYLARVDESHSNVATYLPPEVAWPDQATWERLRNHDVLYEERLADLRAAEGTATFSLDLPMPGVARFRLRPKTTPQ